MAQPRERTLLERRANHAAPTEGQSPSPYRQEAASAHVLVVDDDEDVRLLITRYLTLEGFHADQAGDADAALAAVRRHRPDLVLLDVMLPGRDGLDLLAQLRREGDVAVILVSAKGEEADRVMGLRLGADDYIVKPFSPTVLVARIGAVSAARAAGARAASSSTGWRSTCRPAGSPSAARWCGPPTKEFDLLAFLALSPSQVFTRNEVLASVWGSSSEWQDPDTVTEHIHRIRQMIEDDPAHPRWIRTVRGVGYSFEP